MTVALTLLTAFILSTEVPAKISYLVGNVSIYRNGVTQAGALNTALNVNDVVTTADQSACEIQFANYSLVRLAANSSIKIERKEKTNKGVFHRIFAAFGEVVSKVTKLNKNDRYEMRTDAAQAYIRGTTFKTFVDQAGASQFTVFEGKLRVKSLLAGAKEIICDKNFKSIFAKGKAAPIVTKLSALEIGSFQKEFQEFIDRGKIMEDLKAKAEKEIDKQKDKIIDKGNQIKKSCIFW